MPLGIVGSFNQETYSPPANGCGYLEGVPQQAGLFIFNVSFKVDLQTWLFNSSCGGFLPPSLLTGEEIDLSVSLRILPDPSFSGLDTSVYCISDSVRTLVPEGTQGGVFSGPGVSGNQFDPAIAGPGLHAVKYVVSAMEGTAVEPETDSLVVWVEVIEPSLFYADMDGDGFGNPFESIFVCFPPEGFVDNNDDCDDDNPDVYPGAPNGPDGTVNDCNLITGLINHTLLKLEVFPNPTFDQITIRGDQYNGPVHLNIHDASGRLVHSEMIHAAGMLHHNIQISVFGKGWYILRVDYEGEVARRGVVVR
ncbi:MAG: T9SS C-terminal target domain-containing protein [Cryomorphaceae bacterium]|nr:MAG: T9SS C-terminal target domain-containing protein [Cryomorphaceae bacterium]